MLLNVKEVMELLGIKQNTAYKVIRDINAEMKEKGYRTLRGRVLESYLCERYGLKPTENKKYTT